MNRVFIICFGLMMISKYAAGQFTLEIEISEIKNNTGNIMLQLFDENQKVLTQEMSAIKNKKCVFTVKNLRSGKFGPPPFEKWLFDLKGNNKIMLKPLY